MTDRQASAPPPPIGIEGHDLVRAVLDDPATFSTGGSAVECGQVRPLLPLQAPPDRHGRLRSRLEAALAPSALASFEPRVRARAAGLLDDLAAAGGGDGNAGYSRLLPVWVYLDLLDLPPGDLELVRELHDGVLRERRRGDPPDHPAPYGRRIYAYLEPVVADRRRRPRGDVLSRLMTAEGTGPPMSDQEVVDTAYTLLLASIAPVAEALSCTLALLAGGTGTPGSERHPDLFARGAVEELLRWGSPVKAITRVATTSAAIDGTEVSAGSRLSCDLAAANHDPAVFPEPGRFDPTRRTAAHVAFGAGPHRCIGSYLARLEIRITIEEAARRLGDLSIAEAAGPPRSPAQRRAGDPLPLRCHPTGP